MFNIDDKYSIKDWNYNGNGEPCKIRAAFRRLAEENKKLPSWLRKNYVMVSCNCPRCRVIC